MYGHRCRKYRKQTVKHCWHTSFHDKAKSPIHWNNMPTPQQVEQSLSRLLNTINQNQAAQRKSKEDEKLVRLEKRRPLYWRQ